MSSEPAEPTQAPVPPQEVREPRPTNNPLVKLWRLLDTTHQDYDTDTKLIIEFIKQLIKSTGTGLLITLAFRMLRHIRNIGRPGKILADLFNFYRTKSAYSTGLLCFILCFFIRGGVTFQKIFRRDGKINYFIPGGKILSSPSHRRIHRRFRHRGGFPHSHSVLYLRPSTGIPMAEVQKKERMENWRTRICFPLHLHFQLDGLLLHI
jgi:hypothetical protein